MTKSERWKPEDNQKFYFVNNMITVSKNDYIKNYAFDVLRYENGNCFKTEAEAQTAAEKVKALLLSLHKPVTACNQLPKLTAEVFDRPDCPEWANFAVVDQYGWVWLTAKKPNVVMVAGKANGWSTGGDSYTYWSDRNFDASDWQNSLIERPANLPAWCKVGKWVWDIEDARYVKIISITDMVLLCTKDKCTYYEELKDMAGNYKQARLRPYNADEMRGLIGKVLESKDEAHLIYAFDKTTEKIETPYAFFDAQLLLDGSFTIDGKPCGVLEHLKDERWVE